MVKKSHLKLLNFPCCFGFGNTYFVMANQGKHFKNATQFGKCRWKPNVETQQQK